VTTESAKKDPHPSQEDTADNVVDAPLRDVGVQER
jgi:hypothetical protein